MLCSSELLFRLEIKVFSTRECVADYAPGSGFLSHQTRLWFLFWKLQVEAIARKEMGTNDTKLAVEKFREKLNSSASFFNDQPIPLNESDKNAHKKCSSPADAERYCPVRWKALMLWFKESRRVSVDTAKIRS